MKTPAYPGGGTVAERLTNNIATIGENQSLRRAAVLEVSEGAVVSYVHNAAAPGLGKIGVLVALESSADGRRRCRRSASRSRCTSPRPIRWRSTPTASTPALIERERAIAMEKAKESGKPANIVEKMVEGTMAKFRKEHALTDPAVRDGQQDPGRRRRRAGGQGGRRADHAEGASCASSSARASRRRKATSPPKSPRLPASSKPEPVA